MTATAFLDPVRDAQANFRAVLRAMSSPGAVMRCAGDLAPPYGLSSAAAAAILTLADFETPLWIEPSFPGYAEVAAYLRFHTGAPFAASRETAAFALADAGVGALELKAFARGVAEYPDRSTTIVVQVHAMTEGVALNLAGPGVKGGAKIAPRPLPEDFLEQWRANREGFPLGVDLILCADREIAALPRSIDVTEAI